MAPVVRRPVRCGWRSVPYKARETVALTRIWLKHTTFNQRAAGLLALVLIGALIRSEVRTVHANRVAVQASHEVKGLLEHSTSNRVANVRIWCNHFVTLEGALVGYVSNIPGAPHLSLDPLTPERCHDIEYGTAASTK